MLFTIILMVLSLSLGGLLFALGVIQTLLETLQNQLKSVGSVIRAQHLLQSELTLQSVNSIYRCY